LKLRKKKLSLSLLLFLYLYLYIILNNLKSIVIIIVRGEKNNRMEKEIKVDLLLLYYLTSITILSKIVGLMLNVRYVSFCGM